MTLPQTSPSPRLTSLRPWQLALTLILLGVYLAYLWFIIQGGQGAIDYETFMALGHRLLNGQEVYIENSYYPLPYVMIFAFFAWLPRPISMAVWHSGVVVAVLAMSGGQPWALLFAPVFAHFVGGQTSVLPMLGLWGYRRDADPGRLRGGVWLALALFKPQLALVPLAWAGAKWWRSWRQTGKVPRQAWGWLITALAIYLPSFAIMPDWPLRWLRQPRPLFERALEGIAPRALVMLGVSNWVFWPVLTLIAAGLIFFIWRFYQKRLTLDLAVLWSFIVSPLAHDYDLVQVIPLLTMPALQWGAVLLSIPVWLVILFAYGNDQAWAAVTLFAPGLLLLKMALDRKASQPSAAASETEQPRSESG